MIKKPTAATNFSCCRFFNFMSISVYQRLFSAENAVAGVAETRHDVSVVVELFVDRGAVDFNVRMFAVETFNAFRCGDQVNAFDFFDPVFF